ncbi:arginine--tRNA ligase [uncultured Flavobacterium sp.]|uniref:arginine--tRNA ligase n=1 Tax=uncultured Flavobacterium sp. TaxID=165435 RepID=UPI0030ED4E2C|tara:strand:- start:255807 stop:257582 length:1776 start_codon:yes stop_codon:yes gene_type:complete
MTLHQILTHQIQDAIQELFNLNIETIEFQATRKDFEGDVTMVVFPLVKILKGNPVEIGTKIGTHLVDKNDIVSRFNVVGGFLNLVISDEFYVKFFNSIKNDEDFGFVKIDENAKAIMVEYSSPNTNKPLHLGHIRNILLGYSVAEIIKASGKKAYKTQIINDRGIHICKSMLAWQKYGEGQTPESTGLKGDKLVGNFYVEFDKNYKKEIAVLMAQGKTEDEAKKVAPSIVEAQQMLLKWEAGDEEVVTLWKTMNQWVYNGFEATYKNLGVNFDSYYYESNTYLLGKEVVQLGLEKGIFEKDPDGSVWIDLTEDGLDRKIVLRSDGTAVYMTQDIGTAIQRVKDNPDIGGMVYTVGNEQDYHFKVLFLILKKLGFEWAESLYHLSYGMVELPSGKMKSREGTVVDADDLMAEMIETAQNISEDLGKLDGYSDEEKSSLYETIGMGALKYYMLKVDPKKQMLFNPEESVDFAGNTGPFIQYTFARIQSILRKADFDCSKDVTIDLHEKEKELIKQVQLYPDVIQSAASNYSPALIANYTYELVKEFNSFYQQVSILGETDLDKKIFRVQLSKTVGNTIKSAFQLLGIQVPERM